MKRYLLLPVIVLVATGQLALADHCETYSTSATDFPEGRQIVLAPEDSEQRGAIYLVADICQLDGCLISFFIYMEGNGIPGLQRADAEVIDTCHGSVRPDSRLI